MTSEAPTNGNLQIPSFAGRKTVTAKKLAANRRNALHSTGPRTERGKCEAKFNTVTLGLFAKHIVIPGCDGENAEKDLAALLHGLHNDFPPVGFYEAWLLARIAEYIWRLRRATRCESGSVRKANWNENSKYDSVIKGLLRTWVCLRTLRSSFETQEHISPKNHTRIVALMEQKLFR